MAIPSDLAVMETYMSGEWRDPAMLLCIWCWRFSPWISLLHVVVNVMGVEEEDKGGPNPVSRVELHPVQLLC